MRYPVFNFASNAKNLKKKREVVMLQIEIWQLVSALVAIVVTFATMIWAFGKILAGQFKDSLDARFATQDELRKQRELAMDERFRRMEEDLEGKAPHYNERISYLEANAKKSPTHGDIAKVYESLNTLSATVNQLVGENRGQSDTLKLILNQIAAKGMR
jgi:hypothetical protein